MEGGGTHDPFEGGCRPRNPLRSRMFFGDLLGRFLEGSWQVFGRLGEVLGSFWEGVWTFSGNFSGGVWKEKHCKNLSFEFIQKGKNN